MMTPEHMPCLRRPAAWRWPHLTGSLFLENLLLSMPLIHRVPKSVTLGPFPNVGESDSR